MVFRLKVSVQMYLLVLLMFLFISPAINGYLGILGIPISHILLIYMPLAVITLLYKYKFKDVFMLNKIENFNYIFKGILLWFGALIVSSIYAYYAINFFDSQELTETFNYIFSSTTLAQQIIIMAVLPAIIEELMFRGFLFSSFLKHMSPVFAIMLSGLLFAIMHFSLIKIFTTFLLGVVFAFTVYKTKSVYSSMILHFINNLMSVLMQALIS